MRAFRVAYDGRSFHGYQRQPSVETVEGVIFSALRELDILTEDAHRPPGYRAASRTDAGVSATHQTITLDGPEWLTPSALNSSLPPTIRVWASGEVSAEFHATHDAIRRAYGYYFYTQPPGSGVGSSIDTERVQAATARLSGTHDFHNLTPDDTGTERTLEIDVEADPPFLILHVESDGFPRELVRRLVTLVRSIGQGDSSLERIDRVLDPYPLEGPAGVGPAPPEPLVLTDVTYQDCTFSVGDEAAAGARAVYETERIEELTGARILEHLRDGVE